MKRRASANIYQRQSLLKDIREISDIGWFNMQYIKLFDNGNNQLESVIKPSIKIVKNFVKYNIR